jgi:hypothetical protein
MPAHGKLFVVELVLPEGDLLRAQGTKKGIISEAVKWRLFNQIVSEVRAAFADLSTDDLMQFCSAGRCASPQLRRFGL